MSLITDPNAAPPAGSPPAGGPPVGTPPGSQTPPAAGAFDYRSVLPEDIRNEKTFEAYAKAKDKDELLQHLARGYHGAQGLIGKKGLLPPSESATPEERAAFRKELNKTLGVPERFEDYKVELPKDAKLDPAKVESWKQKLHMLGIPQSDAGKIFEAYIKEEAATEKAEADKLAGWENETKTRLGANLDRELNFARAALREFDKDGKLGALLEETGLGSHPEVVTLLSKVGNMVSERGPRGQGSAIQSSNLSPDQAQVEIQQFERTHREALFNASHPDHGFAVKRRQELYLSAFPKKSA
jgi:hypothetical protein